MTAIPESESVNAHRLLTIAEYLELGETEHGYTELIEGRVVTSPCSSLNHNLAMKELCMQLWSLVPDQWQLVHGIDIDLELAPEDAPGFSRRPDAIVFDPTTVLERTREGGMCRASEVLLAIEIVSPGSRRIDHVDKRRDYADAGIPYYWIVDIDDPISLVACHLTEEFGYQDDQVVTGTFRTQTPFPVEINLDLLR